MNSIQHFSEQLKRAQLRRKNKKTSQVTNKVTTVVGTTVATKTTKTIVLTEQQYKNVILAKAVTYIRGRA